MTWFGRRRGCKCAASYKAIEESIDQQVLATSGITVQLIRLNRQLGTLIELLKGGADRPRFNVTAGPPRPKENPMFSTSSTIEEKVPLNFAPVTSQGNPAPIDGPVTADLISGDATVEPISDTSFFVVSGSAPGVSVFLVSADADLGQGVTHIQETVEYTVTDALAVNLGITAGAPVPK